MLNIANNYRFKIGSQNYYFDLCNHQGTPASRPARFFWISKTLGEFWRKPPSRRFATLRILAKKRILKLCCVS